MATYTCTISTHQTAGTGVDEIDLAADVAWVEVLARTGSPQTAIYFCVDGEGGPNKDGVPTVGGADCYVVPSLHGAALRVKSRLTTATKVKLISGAGQAYTVTGFND